MLASVQVVTLCAHPRDRCLKATKRLVELTKHFSLWWHVSALWSRKVSNAEKRLRLVSSIVKQLSSPTVYLKGRPDIRTHTMPWNLGNDLDQVSLVAHIEDPTRSNVPTPTLPRPTFVHDDPPVHICEPRFLIKLTSELPTPQIYVLCIRFLVASLVICCNHSLRQNHHKK